jgi:hypothetical protein
LNLIRVMPAEGSQMSDQLTQLQAGRRGLVTAEMDRVAEREQVAPELIRDEVARGRLVIPANKRHLAGSGGEPPQPVPSEVRRAKPRANGIGDAATTSPRPWVD